MANSKNTRLENGSPVPGVLPAGTPGPMGRNDASDPSTTAMFGDTPGPLGRNDGAARSAMADPFLQGNDLLAYLQNTVAGDALQGTALLSLPKMDAPLPEVAFGQEVSTEFKRKVICDRGEPCDRSRLAHGGDGIRIKGVF